MTEQNNLRSAIHNALVDDTLEWFDNINDCPLGRKVFLLTDQGVAVVGEMPADRKGYKGWRPMFRDKKLRPEPSDSKIQPS